MESIIKKPKSKEPWTREKQRTAERIWKEQNTVKLTLQFNKFSDADILEWMNTREETRTSYLRRLIRADMAREQEK